MKARSAYRLPFRVCREHYGALDVFPSVKIAPGRLSRNRYYVILPPERAPWFPAALCDSLLLPEAARRFTPAEIPGGERYVGVEESPRGFTYKLYFATPAEPGPTRRAPVCIRAVCWAPGADTFSTKEYEPIGILSEAGALAEVRAALAARRGGAEDARARRVLDACMEVLALSTFPTSHALRAEAPEEGRCWIDIKLDDRRPVTLRDVERPVLDVARTIGANAALCADWLKTTQGDLLSHLAVGSSGDGPFVTLYHVGRHRRPLPYAKSLGWPGPGGGRRRPTAATW
jgi:hypothetical protein